MLSHYAKPDMKILDTHVGSGSSIIAFLDFGCDWIGFEIPDEFVVGYGLDFGEIYRNLPYIAILRPEIFAHLEEI